MAKLLVRSVFAALLAVSTATADDKPTPTADPKPTGSAPQTAPTEPLKTVPAPTYESTTPRYRRGLLGRRRNQDVTWTDYSTTGRRWGWR